MLADGADGDRRARRAVRGVQVDGAGVGTEERVEAAAADDSEHFFAPHVRCNPSIVGHAASRSNCQVQVLNSPDGRCPPVRP